MLKLLFTEDSRKKCEITFKGLLKAVILYKKKMHLNPKNELYSNPPNESGGKNEPFLV